MTWTKPTQRRLGATSVQGPNIGDRRPQTPVRAGYAVGYWLVRQLYQHFELSDLARWPRERVNREVEQALLFL